MGFCTDTENPGLMAFMAEQCPMSCGFVDCPGDGIGSESGSSAATTTVTTTLTTTPSTTSVTTMPSASPSAARPQGTLTPIRLPMAVSALDITSFAIVIGWDTDLDVGPVELVPRFAMLRAYDDGSEGGLPRVSQGNVIWQSPIHLNTSSGVTTITITIKPSKLPLVPGV